jgi:hypothetical protein
MFFGLFDGFLHVHQVRCVGCAEGPGRATERVFEVVFRDWCADFAFAGGIREEKGGERMEETGGGRRRGEGQRGESTTGL